MTRTGPSGRPFLYSRSDNQPATLTVIGTLLGIDNPVTWAITLVVGLVVGTLIGAFHGWMVGYLTIPAFIVTLGGFLVWRVDIERGMSTAARHDQ